MRSTTMRHRLHILVPLLPLLLLAACAGAGGGQTASPEPSASVAASVAAPSPSVVVSPSAVATEDPCPESMGGGYGVGGEYETTPKPGCGGGASTAPSANPCDGTGGGTDEYEATPAPGCVAPSPGASAGESDDTTALAFAAAGDMGEILTGKDGLTLYVFDNDEGGNSACGSGCVETWPPATTAAGVTPTAGDGVSGEIGSIERDDGTHQITYDGRPVYYYAGDDAPGDAAGDGLGGLWHVVRP